MDAVQIRKALHNLNETDLRSVYEEAVAILKQNQTNKQFEATKAFKVSDKVFFISKYGARIEGTIAKINVKSIKVTTTQGIWNVSPSLLQKVA